MQQITKYLLACILVLPIAACSGGGGGPTAPETTGVIRISNTSSLSITEVNVSRCDIAVWGSNRIASSITPGRFAEIELTPNCYDVRLFANNFQHLEFFDILLQAGATQTITVFDQ